MKGNKTGKEGIWRRKVLVRNWRQNKKGHLFATKLSSHWRPPQFMAAVICLQWNRSCNALTRIHRLISVNIKIAMKCMDSAGCRGRHSEPHTIIFLIKYWNIWLIMKKNCISFMVLNVIKNSYCERLIYIMLERLLLPYQASYSAWKQDAWNVEAHLDLKNDKNFQTNFMGVLFGIS